MKKKTQPLSQHSLSNPEFHCLKGLSKKGREWAKDEIKKARELGEIPFYNIIRKAAEKM